MCDTRNQNVPFKIIIIIKKKLILSRNFRNISKFLKVRGNFAATLLSVAGGGAL